MQFSEEEIQAKCSSSPNLRSKCEEGMIIKANSSCVDPNVSLLGQNKGEKVVNTSEATAAVQPPLLPYPPPPDTPPKTINLEQEIEDDEYGCGNLETSSKFNQSKEPKAATRQIKTEESSKYIGVKMCHDFVRGCCNMGAGCRYAHKIMLSELPLVYEFCKDFQNSTCYRYSKCKFVHATVFEKEHFYRTGYLPPNTIAHLQKASELQPSPQPPHFEGASVAQPSVNCIAPPPPPQISCIPPVAERNNAEAVIEPNMYRIQPDIDTNLPTSRKLELDEIGEASNATRDSDSGDSHVKKCHSCGTKDESERLLDAQLAKARQRKEALIQDIAEVSRKINLIAPVLSILSKPNE